MRHAFDFGFRSASRVVKLQIDGGPGDRPEALKQAGPTSSGISVGEDAMSAHRASSRLILFWLGLFGVSLIGPMPAPAQQQDARSRARHQQCRLPRRRNAAAQRRQGRDRDGGRVPLASFRRRPQDQPQQGGHAAGDRRLHRQDKKKARRPSSISSDLAFRPGVKAISFRSTPKSGLKLTSAATVSTPTPCWPRCTTKAPR